MTADTKPQTLGAWLESRILDLEKFAADWRLRQGIEGKDDWPDKMTPGDWDEQYVAFREDDE